MSQPEQRTSRLAKEADSASRSSIVNFLPSAGGDFVLTPYVQDLTDRALAYLEIGYAVHLSGPAGTGKSTLAMHIASKLGRSCTLLHGDDEYRGSDLIGRDSGYSRTSIRDNYVSSIVKTQETFSTVWASNRLTTACQQGFTLIYDEFTRSPATANNPLLSVLEEGILNIPSSGDEKGYIQVHKDFRAIFTSNPEEYAGVHKTQDALLDRMITIELEHADQETEAAIVVAKSGLSMQDALLVVGIIRKVRQLCGYRHGPTVRAALAISQIIQHRGCKVDVTDPIFQITCQDVLYFNASRQSESKVDRQTIRSVVSQVCGGRVEQEIAASPVVAPSVAKPTIPAPTIESEVLEQAGQLVEEMADELAGEPSQALAVGPPEAIDEGENESKNEDDSLQAAMKHFENLSVAVRHLEPAARSLPRPPVMAVRDGSPNLASTL